MPEIEILPGHLQTTLHAAALAPGQAADVLNCNTGKGVWQLDQRYRLIQSAPDATVPARWSPITEVPCPMGVQLDPDHPFTPNSFRSGATTTVWSAIRHRTVGPSASGLKLLFGWWGVAGSDDEGSGAQGEVMLPNGGTIRAWIQQADGSRIEVQFAGEDSYTFDPMSVLPDATKDVLTDANYPAALLPSLKNVLALSDVVEIEIGAAMTFHCICEISVTDASHTIPGGLRLLSASGSDGFVALSEGAGNGVFDPNSTSITMSGELNAYGPLAILGYGNHRSCACTGDSHFAGTGDIGIRQGLDGAAGRMLAGQTGFGLDLNQRSTCGMGPWLAKGGEAAYQVSDGSAFKVRLAAICLSGVRNVVTNYGPNDLNATPPRTIGQIKADVVTLTKLLTDIGPRVIWVPPPPKTSSTDDWETVTNQTPASDVANRRELRRWIRSGEWKDACLAAGSSRVLLRVANIFGAVACNRDGTPNPIGDYFLPNQKPGGHVGWQINSSNQLGSSTFRDDANLVSPHVVKNQYRGYTCSVTRLLSSAQSRAAAVPSSNVGSHRTIRFLNNENGTMGTEAFGSAHQFDSFDNNDPVPPEDGIDAEIGVIDEKITREGTHLSGPGARMAANSFDPTLLLGYAMDVSGSTLPVWSPADADAYYMYDTQTSGCVYSDILLTAPIAPTDTHVGGLKDLVNRSHWSQPDAVALDNLPAWRPTHFAGKPYVLFPGVTEYLRWKSVATTIASGGASGSLTHPFASSAGLFAGDWLTIGTTPTAQVRQIDSVDGDGVYITLKGGAFTTSGGEAVRRTIPQPFTVLMLAKIESTGSGEVLFSSGHGSGMDRAQFMLSTGSVEPTGNQRNFTAGTAIGWGDVQTASPHFYACVIDGANTTFYVDGVLDTVGLDPGANPFSGLTLGTNNAATPTTAFSNFALGWFMVVNGAMTGYDISRVWETYLRDRWAL